MSWDDKPPTANELKATEPAPAASTASSGWDSAAPTQEELDKTNTPFSSMGDTKVNELLKTGYNFDTYNKLSPDEKQLYEDLSAKHAKVFQEAVKRGGSAGLTLGFNKDLFNNPEDVQNAKAQLPADQQALAGKEASVGGLTGNLVGGLPIALATGGATAAVTKGISAAAELGPIATRVVQGAGNVVSGGALGEAQGIANSNAPTLAGKAQEALPNAALGAGIGLGAEGLAAAPEIAEAVSGKVQPVVQGAANKFAFNSLKPTSADLAKVNAKPGLKNQIGQYLNDNNLVTPLSNQQDIAQNISAARQAAGQEVGNATNAIDNAVAQTTAKPGANVPEIETSAIQGIKPNQANDVESAGLDIQDLKKNYIGTIPGLQGTSSLTGGLGETRSQSLSYVPVGKTANAEVTSSSLDLTPSNNLSEPPAYSSQTLGGVSNLDNPTVNTSFPAKDNINRQITAFENPDSLNIIPVENAAAKQVVNPKIEQAIAQNIASQPASIQQKVQQILSPERIANELETQVLTPITKAGDAANVVPVIQQQLLKFQNIEDTSLSNLFKYRQQLDDAINFNKNPLTGQETPISKALKTYRGAVDSKLMDAAKQVDDLTEAGAYDALVAAKKEYSLTSTANNIAQRSANQVESSTAKAAIPALGAAIGKGAAVTLGTGGTGIIPAAVGATAAYVGKKYGNQFAATSLNQLSDLLKTSPQTLGEFAAPLQDAANRGSAALAATNFALYQNDPKYRAVVDPLQKAGEDQAKTEGGQ